MHTLRRVAADGLLRRRGARARARGVHLEDVAARTLARLGKWRVRRNVRLVDAFGNTSEIDVVYGVLRRRYVECKNYAKPVGLEAVAKFKEVLVLNGISPSRGVFITTSEFSPRALAVARLAGMRTIDGRQLRLLRARAVPVFAVRMCVRAVLALGVAAVAVDVLRHPPRGTFTAAGMASFRRASVRLRPFGTRLLRRARSWLRSVFSS